MSWKIESFGSLLTESKIPSEKPNVNRRIRVRLNVQGVEKRPVVSERKGATKQYIRKAGQFIYGKQNFHKGSFGVVPNELDGFETSADIPSFDVREDCLPEWIYYFFKAGNRYLELTKYARGIGSQRIHPKQLEDLKIPLPPIDIQRKIISELQNIEKDEIAIELSHQLSLVTQLRQAFLREAMQGKLVEQNPADEPASELLARIKAEKKQLIKEKKLRRQKPLPPIEEEEIPFEIPKSWVWCRLGDVYQTTSGGTPSRGNTNYWGGSITWYKSGELNDGYLSKDSKEKITELGLKKSSANLFPKGTLLIAMYGATAGKLSILDVDATTNQAVCGFFENSFIITRFLFFFFLANRSKMIEESWGMSQPNISQTYLRNFIFALPPLPEQKRIVAKLDELMSYCDQLEESIKNSQEQNEMLLGQVLREGLEGERG